MSAAKRVFENNDLQKHIFSFHTEFQHETRINKCTDYYKCTDVCYKCIFNTYCIFYMCCCCCYCNCYVIYDWFKKLQI